MNSYLILYFQPTLTPRLVLIATLISIDTTQILVIGMCKSLVGIVSLANLFNFLAIIVVFGIN